MTKRDIFSILGLIIVMLASGACSVFGSQRPDQDSFTSVAYSPDGKFIAAGTNFDNRVRLWDAGTGELIYTLKGHSGRVNSVAFSPDGSILASGSIDQTAIFWNVATGEKMHVFKPEPVARENYVLYVQIFAVAFSPDGKWFAAASQSDTVHIWDTASKELVRILDVPYTPHGIAFSPEGGFLAVSAWGKGPYLWDTTNFQMTRLGPEDSNAMSFAFSPDSKTMAVAKEGYAANGDRQGMIELWDVASQRMVKSWKAADFFSSKVISYSPDGQLLAYSHGLELFNLWDASTSQAVPINMELPPKPNSPYSDAANFAEGFAFSPDGTHIAVAANFSTLGVWDIRSGKLLWQFSR